MDSLKLIAVTPTRGVLPLELQRLCLSLAMLLKLAKTFDARNQIKWRSLGICYNWMYYYEELYGTLPCALGASLMHIVSWQAMDWKHSRSPGRHVCYPIKDDYGQGRWEGKNRIYRVSLMKHILARLEALTRCMTCPKKSMDYLAQKGGWTYDPKGVAFAAYYCDTCTQTQSFEA